MENIAMRGKTQCMRQCPIRLVGLLVPRAPYFVMLTDVRQKSDSRQKRQISRVLLPQNKMQFEIMTKVHRGYIPFMGFNCSADEFSSSIPQFFYELLTYEASFKMHSLLLTPFLWSSQFHLYRPNGPFSNPYFGNMREVIHQTSNMSSGKI